MKPTVTHPKDPFVPELRRRLKRFFKKIEKLGDGISRRNIHQLRVLSRRLRATFGVLKKNTGYSALRPLVQRVKKLTGLLSPIRSLDVSEDLLRVRLRALPAASRKRLACCIRALQELRRESRRQLRSHGRRLAPPAQWKKTVERLGSHQVAGWPQALQRRLLKTRRQAARALAAYRSDPHIARLHQFRIRLKKYRYVLELQTNASSKTEARLKTLKSLQDDIGELHDLEVLKELLLRARVATAVRAAGAEKDWRDFLHRLESDLAAGERNFLSRHRRRLQSLFRGNTP